MTSRRPRKLREFLVAFQVKGDDASLEFVLVSAPTRRVAVGMAERHRRQKSKDSYELPWGAIATGGMTQLRCHLRLVA